MNTNDPIQTPRLADRFFQWYCRNELQESIQGDMYERYEDYRSRYSKRKSDFLYWMDAFMFINRHTLKRKTQTKRNLIPTSMVKNYILVSFRNIKRNLTFTTINVIGLSVSMAVCLLIMVMIDDQTSYDDFHQNKDKIYRVIHNRLNDNMDIPLATTPMALGQQIKNEYPGVQHVVQFARGFNGEIFDNGKAINLSGLFANQEVFNVFDFSLKQGDIRTALVEPSSVVLKKEIAEKLFWDQDPLGQHLVLENLGQFTVTGVLDELPGKTHINFEALASFSTMESKDKQSASSANPLTDWERLSSGWNYFILKEDHSLADFQVYLNELEQKHYNEETEYLVDFDVQHISTITPGPLMGNQIGQSMPNFFVYGLVVLAVLIMSCAAFNYANLSAARSLTRFKEVGVRKVMGSSKAQVIGQFIVEAILVSLLSLVLAIMLLQLLIPAFEGLSMSSLLNWQLDPDLGIYLQFVGFSLITGLATGFFPSLYMSSVKPVNALKGAGQTKKSKLGLKKSLIVMQLVISIILIVSSTLVYRQINFMISKDFGYDRANMVNIDMQGQDYDLLKPELEKLPFVQNVSSTNNIPNVGQQYDVKYRVTSTDDKQDIAYFSVDENYIPNLKLELIAGRNFTPNQQQEKEIIINEQAAKAFGYASASEAIGGKIILDDSTDVTIAGIVKDYNYQIVYLEIAPMLLRYKTDPISWAQVKVAGNDRIEELKTLEATWASFDPNHDFEYQFFDEQIEDFHSLFLDIVYIIGLISILSIVIAGMGLLGIATYSIQTRMKEVGIRKILGASGGNLVLLLGKGFFIMIILSTVIGASISFFGNKAWLDLFAYRINFGLDVVAISFLFILLVGGLTVLTQTLKAMRTNPSDILRDE